MWVCVCGEERLHTGLCVEVPTTGVKRGPEIPERCVALYPSQLHVLTQFVPSDGCGAGVALEVCAQSGGGGLVWGPLKIYQPLAAPELRDPWNCCP